jgi:CHAT domain-containing protein
VVLYLDDGTRVLSIGLRSARWARKQRPFLFVNACQVGSAGALLGEWSGFAGNSIHGGFGAFLAPLWSVIDEDAKDFALGFYHSMLAEQKTPEETLPTAADVLRRLRGGYKSGTKLKATYLAYVFYGHPLLRVRHGAKKQLQSAL